MANACDCDVVLGNTGTARCKTIASVTESIILVPMIANDGTENVIDLTTDVLDQTFFDGKFNEEDPSKRWYPITDIKNIEDVRADAAVETLNSGENVFLRQGSRTFTGVLVQESIEYLDKLQGAQCTSLGVLTVDTDGSIMVNGRQKDIARPIRVDERTVYNILLKTTDSESQKIQLNFEYHRSEKDKDLRIIKSTDIAADLTNMRGLLDVYGELQAGVTTTQFAMVLESCFGSFGNENRIKGLLEADFEIYNRTTSSVVPSTLFSEVDGLYTFDYAAQTSADVMELRIVKVNSYLDDTNLRDIDILIP